MRWLLAAIVGVGLMTSNARAQTDPIPALMPTTPQVPAPQIGNGQIKGNVKDAGTGPMNAQPGPTPASCSSCQSCQPSGGSRTPLKKLKEWICFCPTPGAALPLLQVHPYNGPYAGTFMCGSPPFSSCGSGKCGQTTSTPAQIPGANYPPSALPAPTNQGLLEGPGKLVVPETPSEDLKPAAPMTPPAASPMFPSRGCQGGSAPIAIEARPDTVGSTGKRVPPPAAIIESVDYRTPGAASSTTSSVGTRGFIAAVPISLQMLTPIEIISPTGKLP